MNPDDLKHRLAQDSDEADDPEAFAGLARHLAEWHAPAPDPQTTWALMQQLEAEFTPPSARYVWQNWWPLLLIRSQIRVVQREIWVASALVMALGTVVTLSTDSASVPLAMIAPLVAAFGVALLYDSDVEQMLELENATGVSTQMLLLARLTLVFGFDLVLAVSGSVVLVLVQTDVSLWPLVLSWLAPMAFLSALSFLLSVVLTDAIVSAVFSLGIWAAHLLLRNFPDQHSLLIRLLAMPGLSDTAHFGFLFVAAGLLLLAALWLVNYEEAPYQG